MFNPYCYKKPTPTDLINIPRLDFLSRSLFREIFSMCRNDPETTVFWHGNKQFTVDLNRGQMILRVDSIANELGVSQSKIRQRLKTINKIYTEMLVEGRPFGSVVTLKDYDTLIDMKSKTESENLSKKQRKYNESVTSNKTVNTDNTVNIYKKNSSKEKQSLQDLTEQFNPGFPLVGR